MQFFISFFLVNAGGYIRSYQRCCWEVFISAFLPGKTSQISSDYARQINQARSQTIEHLQGQLELQAAHLQQADQARLVRSLREIGKSQLKLNRHIANAQLMVNICHGLLVIAVAIAALFAYQNQLVSGPVAVNVVSGRVWIGVSYF